MWFWGYSSQTFSLLHFSIAWNFKQLVDFCDKNCNQQGQNSFERHDNHHHLIPYPMALPLPRFKCLSTLQTSIFNRISATIFGTRGCSDAIDVSRDVTIHGDAVVLRGDELETRARTITLGSHIGQIYLVKLCFNQESDIRIYKVCASLSLLCVALLFVFCDKSSTKILILSGTFFIAVSCL